MATNMAILAYDGCIASGIAGPIDICKFANTHHEIMFPDETSELFSWQVISVDGRPVRTSSNMIFNVDASLQCHEPIDVLIIPGVDHARGREVLELIRRMPPELYEWLRGLNDKGVMIASLCSGTFFLAHAGMLDYRKCTTSWWLTPILKNYYPKIQLQSTDVVTEDGNILCSGAIGSYMHLCIKIIERFGAKEIAKRCAKTILINSQLASQAPFVPLYKGSKKTDEMVHRAIEWLREHLHEELNLERMADQFAVSERTFIRRFKQSTGKPPKQFLQSLRIDEARRLLETTVLSLDEITEKVGYSDVSSFRRLFKREVKLSPADYRKQYGAVFSA